MAAGVMSASQDADLRDLTALCDGDRSALGSLYDRHASLLLSLAERILGNRREAEDLLHDVFVEIWQRAGDYDPTRGSVATWMRLRMRSRALDRVRASSRRERATEISDRLLSSGGLAAADWGIDNADQSTADQSTVRAALKELPSEQSTVLVLSYFAGMSASEIAESIGVPIGTVKSRAAAALAKLRRALDPGEGLQSSEAEVP
jgi:RNA polymerase sigma-70 factor, ECF subfamily